MEAGAALRPFGWGQLQHSRFVWAHRRQYLAVERWARGFSVHEENGANFNVWEKFIVYSVFFPWLPGF